MHLSSALRQDHSLHHGRELLGAKRCDAIDSTLTRLRWTRTEYSRHWRPEEGAACILGGTCLGWTLARCPASLVSERRLHGHGQRQQRAGQSEERAANENNDERQKRNKKLEQSSGGDLDDEGLISDEALRISLNSRLPDAARIRRESVYRAEQTLKQADAKIAALGIDLQEVAALRRKQASMRRPLPELGEGPQVAILAPPPSNPLDKELLGALAASLPSSTSRWLNLLELANMEDEIVTQKLEGCQALAICTASLVEGSLDGLATALQALPDGLRRVVLLTTNYSPNPLQEDEPGISDASESATSDGSTADASQQGEDAPSDPFNFKLLDSDWFGSGQRIAKRRRADEDMLTSAARARLDNSLLGQPYQPIIIESTLGATQEPHQVIAKMPSTVRDATKGLRSMLIGGAGAMRAVEEDAETEGNNSNVASPRAVAAALSFVVRRGVDVSKLTVVGSEDGCEPADWDEIMLPLIGPELWRVPVNDAGKARRWVQEWVDFNYCRGSSLSSSGGSRRGGKLKTPVEARKVALGMIMKFVPTGSRTPGEGFEGLQEGGLELLVDDADENSGRELGRLRVRRCAYSPGARPRETSERAILSNLRRDWEMVQGWRQPK